jgi:hypothetical protein
MHLTCTNMRQGLVDEVLRVRDTFQSYSKDSDFYYYQSAKSIGVQNIMALRGGAYSPRPMYGTYEMKFYRSPAWRRVLDTHRPSLQTCR